MISFVPHLPAERTESQNASQNALFAVASHSATRFQNIRDMKHLVWGLVILLVVLHHDLWNWNNDKLVFGFLPMTLAYHAGLSIAASVVWFMATKIAWPHELEDAAEAASGSDQAQQVAS